MSRYFSVHRVFAQRDECQVVFKDVSGCRLLVSKITESCVDILLPGPPGWLWRIQPLKSRENYYLVGDFFKKLGHRSSSKCSLCETDGYLCRQPNLHQLNPTTHLYGGFRACQWHFRSKYLVCNVERVQLPPYVAAQEIERIYLFHNITKQGLGVSSWQDSLDFLQYQYKICGNRV